MQNYANCDLRGRSFKDRNDLVDADFSCSDIRGVNFTGANLRGANFSNATAGLTASEAKIETETRGAAGARQIRTLAHSSDRV